MWKKDDEQAQRSATSPTGATAARPEPTTTHGRKAGFATIGPSIVIRGEVTGDEDLLIQGQVDGSVSLGLHAVTIGDGGRVKAGITGRIITVEGAVEGDLNAQEQIILRGTARVKGDLMAPRVVLEDGATFRGLVDMGSTPELDSPKRAEAKATKPSQPDATGSKPGTTDAAQSAKGTDGADKHKAEADKAGAGAASGTAKSATG